MEFAIRTVVIIVILLAVAVIVLSLIMRSGEGSNSIIDGIFGFFRDIITGKQPAAGSPETETGSEGAITAGIGTEAGGSINAYP
jgi:hypothetical protein